MDFESLPLSAMMIISSFGMRGCVNELNCRNSEHFKGWIGILPESQNIWTAKYFISAL